MNETNLQMRLERQESAELIRRTIGLYGPLLDDLRFKEWGELFTEDAEWIVPGASFKGRVAIVAGVGAIEPKSRGWVKHLSYPPVIELDSPSTARAWSDLVAMVRDAQSGAWSIAAVGRNYDSLRMEGGVWRIERRQADFDTAMNALPDLSPLPTP
jgi:hypothetical protein